MDVILSHPLYIQGGKKYLKKKFILFFAFFFVFSFLFLSSLYGFIYTNHIIKMDMPPYRLSNETYISIQHESNPLKQSNSELFQQKFLNLNKNLKKISSTKYYEFYNQPLFYEENQISSIQLGLNLQDDMKLQVESGRLFNKSDYVFKSEKPIPVILGSKFQDYFQINDQFEMEYLFAKYTFQVIGFLTPNSTITLIDKYYLDNFILMPIGYFINKAETEEQAYSQLIHNANKVSGILKLQGDNLVKVYNDVKTLLNNSEVGEFSFYSNSIILDYMIQGIDIKMFRTAFLVAIIILIFSVLIILFYIKRGFIVLSKDKKIFFIVTELVELICSIIVALYFVKKILLLDFISFRIISIPILLSLFFYLVLLVYINKWFCKLQS